MRRRGILLPAALAAVGMLSPVGTGIVRSQTADLSGRPKSGGNLQGPGQIRMPTIGQLRPELARQGLDRGPGAPVQSGPVTSPEGKTVAPGEEVIFAQGTAALPPGKLYIQSALPTLGTKDPASTSPTQGAAAGRKPIGVLEGAASTGGTIWELPRTLASVFKIPAAVVSLPGGQTTVVQPEPGKLTLYPAFVAPLLPPGPYHIWYQEGSSKGPASTITITKPVIAVTRSVVEAAKGEKAVITCHVEGPLHAPAIVNGQSAAPAPNSEPFQADISLSANTNPSVASSSAGQQLTARTDASGRANFTLDVHGIGVTRLTFSGPDFKNAPVVEIRGTPIPPPQPALVGFVDMHTHIVGHLGFGGTLIAGLPDGNIAAALADCSPTHGKGGLGEFGGLPAPGTSKPLGDVLGRLAMALATQGTGDRVPSLPKIGNLGHETAGYPDFVGWPRFSMMWHQQAYVDWIKRAHDGGLRIAVCLAVNNKLLANQFRGSNSLSFRDMDTVIAQLYAMKDLAARNATWMEIAYSPEHARTIIKSGKLAIVLGVEVDSLGDWATSDGVSEDNIRTMLQGLYNMGARHIFPIHFSNNAIGGYAVFNELWNATNHFLRGDYTHVDDGRRFGIQYKLYADKDKVDQLSLLAGYSPPADVVQEYTDPGKGGHVNRLGFTDRGESFIKEMMRLGMIIDVDHMSYKATDETLRIAEAVKSDRDQGYPLVAGHTSFIDLRWILGETNSLDKAPNEGSHTRSQVERIAALGGMVAPIVHQGDVRPVSRIFPDQNKVPNDCIGSSKSWAQAYLYAVKVMNGRGVALGTDINVSPGMPCPRFGSYAAFDVRGDVAREQAQPRAQQIAAQSSGVAYSDPIADWRYYRWGGDAIDNETARYWEGIALGLSHDDIDAADPRAPTIEVGPNLAFAVRTPGTNAWIKDVAKGIRAARAGVSFSQMPGLGATQFNGLGQYWWAAVQRGAHLAWTNADPGASSDPAVQSSWQDPEVAKAYNKLRPVCLRFQAMQGPNKPVLPADMQGVNLPYGKPFTHCTVVSQRDGKPYTRDWDYNIDGLAHYGLLPEFIQDVRNDGVPESDMAVLFRSAEDYLQMWAKCERLRPYIPATSTSGVQAADRVPPKQVAAAPKTTTTPVEKSPAGPVSPPANPDSQPAGPASPVPTPSRPPRLKGLEIPAVLHSNEEFTGTVTLNQPAPEGGFVVKLRAQAPGAYLSHPPTVFVEAGKTTAEFRGHVSTVPSPRTGGIVAEGGGSVIPASTRLMP